LKGRGGAVRRLPAACRWPTGEQAGAVWGVCLRSA
jgi:hypothetical protein